MAWAALSFGWLLGSAPASADKSVPGVLSYLLTSSAENGDAPSTWGFNAVDGKPTTAWCTDTGARGQRLVIGFVKSETITHVAVVPGKVVGAAIHRGNGRIRELELNDGREKRMLTLKDDAAAQEVTLDPPMNVRHLSFIIRDIYEGELITDRACIGEIVLRNGNMLLTGDGVARQVRGVARNMLPLMGPWVDNPSAPERYLTLSIDGTFNWAFEPLMEGQPGRLNGTWELGGGRITFKPRGSAKPVVMRVSKDRVATKEGAFEQLTIDGQGGHEKLPGGYRPSLPPVY